MNPAETGPKQSEYKFNRDDVVILRSEGYPPTPTESQMTGEDFVYVIKRRYQKEGKVLYDLQWAKLYPDGKIIEHTSCHSGIEEGRIVKIK